MGWEIFGQNTPSRQIRLADPNATILRRRPSREVKKHLKLWFRFEARALLLLSMNFLSLLVDNRKKTPECIVDRFRVCKNLGNIRFKPYHMVPFGYSLDIFATNSAAEIIFFQHFRPVGVIAHISFSHSMLPRER
jgi:hypothetical protein